jgi:large subunit ribosomal protein L7/L12
MLHTHKGERANMKITIEDVSTTDLASFLKEKLAIPMVASVPSVHAFPPAFLRKMSTIFAYVTNGQKINAIKEVRELTGCGLKEAKDVVEGNFY